VKTISNLAVLLIIYLDVKLYLINIYTEHISFVYMLLSITLPYDAEFTGEAVSTISDFHIKII